MHYLSYLAVGAYVVRNRLLKTPNMSSSPAQDPTSVSIPNSSLLVISKRIPSLCAKTPLNKRYHTFVCLSLPRASFRPPSASPKIDQGFSQGIRPKTAPQKASPQRKGNKDKSNWSQRSREDKASRTMTKATKKRRYITLRPSETLGSERHMEAPKLSVSSSNN